MIQFEKDMISQHRVLFETARAFLLKFDGVIETQKPRITTYSNANGGICHLRTMPNGIDFGFLKGTKMQDKLGLLSGNGKAIRVLSVQAFVPETVDYYVQQAIALNSQ